MTLEEALSRKQKLIQTLQRLEGRLDAAKSDKMKIEQQIREKKIEPSNLGNVIQSLSERKTTLLQQLEADLIAAENSLQPYLEKKQ